MEVDQLIRVVMEVQVVVVVVVLQDHHQEVIHQELVILLLLVHLKVKMVEYLITNQEYINLVVVVAELGL